MKGHLMYKWRGAFLIAACIILISSGSALGAGFALIEQGVSGLGNAFAGGAAAAEDPSTIFFNPAGITRLQGKQILTGMHVIIPYAKFHNEGSVHVTGAPLSGGNDGNGGETRVVPNLYFSRQVTDRFWVGLGVNSPFGLATKYDRGWVGRYHAIESDLITVNINPSLAYKVTDKLSLGAGFNVQYLHAKLSKQVDFGLIGYSYGIPGLLPQQNDGFAELDGDSWGIGYNLGALYEFTKNTRVGIGYRSAIDQDLEGDADYSNVPGLLKSSFRDSRVKADITLPDSLSVSVFHQFNPQWAVMADFTWTDWKKFEDLIVRFESGQKDDKTTEHWQDSYRYSLGVTYMPDDKVTIKCGTAYDTSAVSEKRYRTPRVPDSDRIWTTVGMGYKLSDMFGVDLAYAHLFVNDPEIDKSPTGEDRLRGGLKGTFDVHIDIVSVQLGMKF